MPHAHNGFIDLTLQLGMVGLVLFLGGLRLLACGGRAFMPRSDSAESGGDVALGVLYIFVLLYQVTESTIFVGNTIMWMVFISAICR